jgi:hypothetical protein
MRQTLALGVAAVLPLAACAPQIPQISYDDPAALHTEPPKPAKPEPNRRAKTKLVLGRAGNFG